MAIPYGRQSLDESDVRAVVEVLRGDWLTQGPAIVEFERAFAEVCHVPHAVAFSSGTAALHAAAFAAGVGPGDDVVTSAITFAASANCAAYMGATPIFADIERESWNVSGRTVLGALTERTRAIVPVHFTGLPARVAEIRSAVGQDIVIIEDAAHAVGAYTADEVIGECRHADMAVFSFHPVKTITTGEGGMVTTRNEAFRDRLTAFRSHGMVAAPQGQDDDSWLRQQLALGFNYRITDLQCALGTSQLRKLEEFVARRNELAARYREAFSDVEQLELAPAACDGVRHAYHLFVIRHRGGAEARRRLYHRLRERDILVQVHYLPVYLHPWYAEKYGYAPGQCPEAERYYAGCLTLPCFPALSDTQQEHVITEVRRQAVLV
jgi:UDP-4-amino-4,6-dideoxy-N-acetyl-beta-L-altrosamine transaminase